MKQTKLIQRMFCTVAAAFLLVFGVVTSAPITATAAVVSYDKTNIMDDLQDIDTADYPADENGVPQVLRFQEYCYTEKAFYADYYGLYIYIYNPTETALNVSGNYNVANMATGYDAKWDPINFNNVPLEYCSKTENNRFYKFKVSASNLLLPVAKEYAAAHEGERRYDIAGIELKAADGNKTIKDELHAKTYYFSGYAAGCAEGSSVEDEESTLACYSEGLDTIELDVQHTNYRTSFSEKSFTTDDINTVYFSVPQRYFDEYGGLQKILAEWYEYKTDPIFVTSDEDAYAALDDYIGLNIGEKYDDLDWSIFWDEYKAGDIVDFEIYTNTLVNLFGKKYNAEKSDLTLAYDLTKYNQTISTIDWLLKRPGAETSDDFDISAEEIEEYMTWYTNVKFPNKEKVRDKYAKDLFSTSIDTDRLGLLYDQTQKNGYVKQKISADETTDLTIYEERSDWEKFLGGNIWQSSSSETMHPIHVFSASDLTTLQNMSETTFSNTYYVKLSDAFNVKNYVIDSLKKGERPVLFRFAVTDFYCSTARFDKHDLFMSAKDGYVAQETVFLDFDVISLTFRDDKSVDTVIPVCASPIDIINGIEAPGDLGTGIGNGAGNMIDKLVDILVGFVFTVIGLVLVVLLLKLLFWIFKKILFGGE